MFLFSTETHKTSKITILYLKSIIAVPNGKYAETVENQDLNDVLSEILAWFNYPQWKLISNIKFGLSFSLYKQIAQQKGKKGKKQPKKPVKKTKKKKKEAEEPKPPAEEEKPAEETTEKVMCTTCNA